MPSVQRAPAAQRPPPLGEPPRWAPPEYLRAHFIGCWEPPDEPLGVEAAGDRVGGGQRLGLGLENIITRRAGGCMHASVTSGLIVVLRPPCSPPVKCLPSGHRCPPSSGSGSGRCHAVAALPACMLRAPMHGSPGADAAGAFFEQRAMLQWCSEQCVWREGPVSRDDITRSASARR